MKTLITGGTGFLGKALAIRLLDLGFDVSVMGRNQIIGSTLAKKGIHFIAADLTDAKQVHLACQGQNMVFHCGALSSPWGAYSAFHKTNVLGTQNVIEGCQKHHIDRLVHVSTPSIYFDFQHRLNIQENAALPMQACNYYAQTKRIAEDLVDQAFKRGLPTITLRPRGIFGPGDTSLIPRLIHANRRSGVPLIDDGSALVDITYIDNVVDALVACLNAPDSAIGQKFNITNGKPMILKTIVDQLFRVLEEPPRYRPMSYQTASRLASLLEAASLCLTLGRIEPPLTRYSVGVLAKSQTLDITAAKTILDYQAKVSIEEGLNRFAKWWKSKAA